MPFLREEFAKNPLKSRDELRASLDSIIEPLLGCLVDGNSGLDLGAFSAHYDQAATRLEGFSRLLWGLAPLVAGLAQRPGQGGDRRPEDCAALPADGAGLRAAGLSAEGLAAGSDPESPYFWGWPGDRDQRCVEMAAISLALLLAPEFFWEPLAAKAKENLAAWLGSINGVELPPTNWEFFRIFANLALRERGAAYDQARLDGGFKAVEALYRSDGWYQDETNYDLYNPFAFHFYGLVYAKIFGARDPERAEAYRSRARLFASQYLPWFGSDGSALPFGRSLGYRFAATAFFSALAFAGEEILSWGAIKGIILRNLRWWFGKPIFDRAGLLSVGYAYPNLIAAEQYNSPGSPYWALKTYLILALPEDHPFWTASEEALPDQPPITLNGPPNLIVCRTGEATLDHVYALNAGQYPCWESVGSAAKYAKFAYSNRFGFCVSHGSYDLSKTGCDSSLLFSEGDGYWRERRASTRRELGFLQAGSPWAASVWAPWSDVLVKTWLFPWGAWHLRLHEIDSGRELECVEGGFSLPDPGRREDSVYPILLGRSDADGRRAAVDGEGLCALAQGSCSGILDIPLGGPSPRKAELHKPEPNLNILHPRVRIPILRGRVPKGRSILACAVYADVLGEGGAGSAEAAWSDPPGLDFDPRTRLMRIRGGGREEVEVNLPG